MAEYIQNISNKINDIVFTKIRESTHLNSLLEKAAELTGVPPQYIITGLTTVVLFIFVVTFGSYVLLDLTAVLYPAYQSFQALEAENWNNCKDWMQYWIVFGIVNTVGRIGDSLLFWIPGYRLLKFAFFVWCFAPVEKNGSTILYEKYIHPAFVFNAEAAEAVIETVRRLSTFSSEEETR